MTANEIGPLGRMLHEEEGVDSGDKVWDEATYSSDYLT